MNCANIPNMCWDGKMSESSRFSVKAGERLDVLVAEDDPIFRSLLTAALRNQAEQREIQLRLETAENLLATLAILQRSPIDALILDLNLPDSAGIPTLERVLQHHPDLAVVVLTGDNDEDQAIHALEAGAQDYLFKHYSEPLRMLQVTLQAIKRRRRELQEVAAQRQQERGRRMMALGTMTSGIAHEHNNLQTVLLANLEIVLERTTDSAIADRVRRCIDVVCRSSEITRGLLDFASDSRREFEPVDLREVVTAAAPMLEAHLTRHEISFTTRLPNTPVMVLGNHAQLGQVLTNVGINACHAMAGRELRELRFELRTQEDQAVLSVIDSGCGIEERHRSQVFDPFFTTKALGGDISGNGLGLSVCDTFVRHHEGSIVLHSAPDHGTRVDISLPLHRATAEEPTTQEIHAVRLDDREIVLVDQDLPVLEQAGAALRGRGCMVTSTSVGQLALRLMAHRPPDVVVVCTRCEAEGVGMIEALGRDAATAAVPVVALLGGEASWDPASILAPERIAAVLRKPFTDRQLLAAVARAIRSGITRQAG